MSLLLLFHTAAGVSPPPPPAVIVGALDARGEARRQQRQEALDQAFEEYEASLRQSVATAEIVLPKAYARIKAVALSGGPETIVPTLERLQALTFEPPVLRKRDAAGAERIAAELKRQADDLAAMQQRLDDAEDEEALAAVERWRRGIIEKALKWIQ